MVNENAVFYDGIVFRKGLLGLSANEVA